MRWGGTCHSTCVEVERLCGVGSHFIYFILRDFYIIYSDHLLFPSSTSPSSPFLPTHSISWFLSLSKYPQNENQNKRIIQKHKEKHTKNMEFILCWPIQLLLGLRPALGVADITSDALLEKIDFPFPSRC